MSTRANIKLNFGDTHLWLYAHHDGYTEHRGVELAKALQDAWEKTSDQGSWFWNNLVSRLANNIVKNEETPQAINGGDKYEITTGEHGDIEYLYEITANPIGVPGLRFRVYEVDGTIEAPTHNQFFDFFLAGAAGTWHKADLKELVEAMESGKGKLKLADSIYTANKGGQNV